MIKFSKLLSGLLVALLLISNISVAFAQTTDYSKNWANREISKWLSLGVVQTNEKGDFNPSEPIKRIDMAIMLNKLFNYQEKSGTKFSDIAADSSVMADVAKASAAGNFTGNGGKFRPNDPITRQEAAAVFARAFSLDTPGKNVVTKFKDAGKIAGWSKDAVNSMVSGEYMNGVPGNLFAPGDSITRAEAVKIVDNMAMDLKNKEGKYTGDVNGNLVVNARNVILENMTIKGDLYLTEGIGSGEVKLNNVKIAGRTVVKGGGENSIVLNNTSLSGSLIISKKDGKVRVVASGSSEISNIILSSGARLEESNLTGGGFGNVDIIQLAPGQQITLDGDFTSLDIEADGVKANIPDGSVGTVNIKEGTNGSKLNIGSTASVRNLVANDDVTVTGGSRIQNADINSNGVVLDTKPVKIYIAPGITASVAGTSTMAAPPAAPTNTAAVVIPPPAPPAGGGGGGGGGVYTPTISLSVTDRSVLLGSTLKSNVISNPADATLAFTSGDPSNVSVNAATGAITGIKTGSAVITVIASRTGYYSVSKSFNVFVGTRDELQDASIYPGTATINTVQTIDISYYPAKRTDQKTVVFNLPDDIKADIDDICYSTSEVELHLNNQNISNSGKTVTVRNMDLTTAPCTLVLYDKQMPAHAKSMSFCINSQTVGETDLIPETSNLSMNIVSTVSDLVCFPEDNYIVASWTSPVSADSVVLKYRTGTEDWLDASEPINEEGSGESSSCSIFSLLPSTVYEVKLVVTGGINSGESNIVTVSTKKMPPKLSAEATSNIPGNDITLTFTSNEDWENHIYGIVVDNRVYYKQYNPGNTNPMFTVAPGKIIIKKELFRNNGRYAISINAPEYSANQIELQIGAINDLSGYSKYNNAALLDFPAPTGAASIKIKQSSDHGGTWVDAKLESSLTVSSTWARCGDLSANTEYLFKLVVTGGMCAGDSNTVSITTQSNIQDFTLTSFNDITAAFTFSAPGTEMTQANIQIWSFITNCWQSAAGQTPVTAITTNASISGLSPNTDYICRISVTGGPNAGNSNEWWFTTADDDTLPTVTAKVDDTNRIFLYFSKPVVKGGIVKVYLSDGFSQLGSSIDLAPAAGVVEWLSPEVARIANTAGGTRLDCSDAKTIMVKITGVVDNTTKANALAETVLTLQAADTKAPVIAAYYTAKAGSTAADDTIMFYFSEAMDVKTLKNLNNYYVTSTAGVYTQIKALSEYTEGVSIDSVASDSKSVTIRMRSGKAASVAGLAFTVYALRDLAGNMIDDANVTPFNGSGPYATAVKATAANKIEIEFNEDIYQCFPGTFILRSGPSSTSPAAAAFINMSVNGRKVTAIFDGNFTTDFSGLYLDVLNCSYTKSFYGMELTTASGILAGGPVAIPDGAKAIVKAFTATTGGIIVEFSETMTTAEAGFISQELLLTRSGDIVAVQATSVSAINGGNLATGFKELLISGLESNREYRIQLFPRGITRDKSVYLNWFTATDGTAVTTK